MKRMAWLVVGVALSSSAIAYADEAKARAAFDEGERAYNLGQFDKAADLFRKAYEEWPEPAFLFNLAQTFRQMGDCKQASFFYKRFLALKEQDTKKPIKPALKVEVEKRIVELDECIKREMASKPPTELDKGDGAGGTGGGGGTGAGGTGGTQTAMTDGDGEDDVDDGEEDDGSASGGGTPTMLALRVGLGTAKLGAGDLDTPFQFAAVLAGGYPLSLGEKLRLDVGAAFTFTPVPYTTSPAMGTPDKGTGSVIGLLANAAPMLEVAPKISVRADVGVGVQLFSGLTKPDNPFTMNGAEASGALTTLLVRAALSAEYAVTPNVAVTLTPIAFSYSPAPDGFDSGISSLTTLSFMAGVGYQR